jgi:hypothetical protein
MNVLSRSALALSLAAAAMAGCNRNTDDHSMGRRPTEPPAWTEPSTNDPRGADEHLRPKDEQRAIGGGPVDPMEAPNHDSAVGRIAAARCDREVRCNNVGAKEKFPNRRECVARMVEYKRAHVNAQACPAGIAERDLENCLDAIRSEDCTSPALALERMNACRSTALCSP